MRSRSRFNSPQCDRRPDRVDYSYKHSTFASAARSSMTLGEIPAAAWPPNGSRSGRVVLVSTDEYEKGRRRGDQIQRMRAYYGHQRRRRLYDLGVANIKRLNITFRTHSEEYWRGYADGLASLSSRGNPAH